MDGPDDMEKSCATLGLGADDVDVIVCTDAGEILGIGDGGAGGVQITVGTPAVYTAAGGIHPDRVISVSLDVRPRGKDCDAVITHYVETASRVFPNALLHFEGFGPERARKILKTCGDDFRIYDDDVQGTGAVVMAAVYAANRVTGIPMKHRTLVVFGAGTAAVGITDALHDAIVADGATDEQACSQMWLVDTRGLLFDDMDDLCDFQATYAKRRSEVPWALGSGAVGLLDTIEGVAPTMLLDTSTEHRACTQRVVEAMCKASDRPLILPISHPISRVGTMPPDLTAWSHRGTTFTIGQANTPLVFPGLGLGVMVSKASKVTPHMLQAAAAAVGGHVYSWQPGATLLPDEQNMRASSALVAEAVVRAAVADRVAAFNPTNVTRAVRDAMWLPPARTSAELEARTQLEHERAEVRPAKFQGR
jgi:malate dehydrogenase (oxaloacetate-decarboxylating)